MVHTVTAQLPVLVVDDEPHLLHSVSLLLRSAGIAPILTLEDSRAALPLLAEQQVGVLLLDLSMPYLSGQELLKQVTADYPDVSVVVMTATHNLKTAVHCMQAGAIDYLVKPVENSRLVSSVRRAPARARLRGLV